MAGQQNERLVLAQFLPSNIPLECPAEPLSGPVSPAIYYHSVLTQSCYLLLVNVSPVLQYHIAPKAVKESVCLASMTVFFLFFLFFFTNPLFLCSNVFFITEMLPTAVRWDVRQLRGLC